MKKYLVRKDGMPYITVTGHTLHDAADATIHELSNKMLTLNWINEYACQLVAESSNIYEIIAEEAEPA